MLLFFTITDDECWKSNKIFSFRFNKFNKNPTFSKEYKWEEARMWYSPGKTPSKINPPCSRDFVVLIGLSVFDENNSTTIFFGPTPDEPEFEIYKANFKQ